MSGTDVALQGQQSQAPAITEPVAEWGRPLEQARSLVAMPEGEWRRMWQVSQVLASSALVPKVLNGNPQGVMAVGLHCRALQVPFTALSVKTHFHVWDDNNGVVIQPSAQLMLGILNRAGHEAWWGPCDEESATLCVVRAGSTRQQDFTYTVAMATKAGLLTKNNWKNHPGLMCRAGACRMAGRYAAPEALLGLEMFDRLDEAAQAPAGTPYEWEQTENMGEHPQLPPPLSFDRPIARLHRQIQALPKDARDELVAEWGRRKLPPMAHPDFPARLDEVEDLVDEATAKAFALPPEADTTPGEGEHPDPPSQTAHAGSPTAGAGRAEAPRAVVEGDEAGVRTDRRVQGQPPSSDEPARPLAQQIAMQAQQAGVDRAHVIYAVTCGAQTSAKDVDEEEGQLVLEAIAAIARGEYGIEEHDGVWRFTERRPQAGQQAFDPGDPGRPFGDDD